jgi:hypothetical protein
MDDRGRLIPQTLSGRHQPATEFCVLVGTRHFAVRRRPQIGAKSTVLFKHLVWKGHVGAKRGSVSSPAGPRPKRAKGLASMGHREKANAWRQEVSLWQDGPSRTRLWPVTQSRSQILEPRRLNHHVIIRERQDLAPSLANPELRVWFAKLSQRLYVQTMTVIFILPDHFSLRIRSQSKHTSCRQQAVERQTWPLRVLFGSLVFSRVPSA